MTWTQRAHQVIRQVIADNPGLDEKALRRKVSDAYPFGPRAHWPYKAWLKAVREAFGTSPKKGKALPENDDQGQDRLDI